LGEPSGFPSQTSLSPGRKVPRASERRYPLIVLSIGIALWLPRLHGPIDLRYDAGAYYVLGTALASGHGYRLLNEPGEVEAVQYPPLLPLFIAAHQRVLGTSDPVVVGRALRLSFCLLSLAYAVAAHALARRYLAEVPALLAALLTALCLYSYFLSDLCFAEIPFALVTTLFVLSSRGPRPWHAAMAGLLGVASVLLRTSGLALLMAWVAESVLARRFRQAATRTALAALPLLLWQAHIERVRSAPEYRQPAYAYQRAPYQYYNVSYAENATLIDPFRPEHGRATAANLLERVLDNLGSLPPRLGEAVSAPQRFWEWSLYLVGRGLGAPDVRLDRVRLPMAFLGVLVVAGLVGMLARGERLIPLYVIASLALIVLTPWPAQFVRYLAALTPFLAVALVDAGVRWLGWLRGRSRRIRTFGLLALAALGAAIASVQLFALAKSFRQFHAKVEWVDAGGRASAGRLFYYDAAWRAFEASLGWLAVHAQPAEIVATSAPHLAYLRTGLKAVMPPLEIDPQRAQQLLDSVPVVYLIVDDLEFTDMSRRYAAPVAESRPDLWVPVYTAARGAPRIYKRSKAVDKRRSSLAGWRMGSANARRELEDVRRLAPLVPHELGVLPEVGLLGRRRAHRVNEHEERAAAAGRQGPDALGHTPLAELADPGSDRGGPPQVTGNSEHSRRDGVDDDDVALRGAPVEPPGHVSQRRERTRAVGEQRLQARQPARQHESDDEPASRRA